jgi:hypothetical protein
MVLLVLADNQATWLFPRSVKSRFAVRWINRFFGLLRRRAFLEGRRAASCLARVIDESDKFSAL